MCQGVDVCPPTRNGCLCNTQCSRTEVLDLIIPGGMKKWIILSESRQDFLEFFVMQNTEMPCVNFMKDVQRVGVLKLHADF